MRATPVNGTVTFNGVDPPAGAVVVVGGADAIAGYNVAIRNSCCSSGGATGTCWRVAVAACRFTR